MSRVFFTDRDLGTVFPGMLSSAGLAVQRHQDHFTPQCPDEEWLEAVGQKRWIAVSHDKRMRYKPNVLVKVRRHRVGLLIVVGKAPLPELARAFVATLPRIETFLSLHREPFIGKVYRPSPAELKQDPAAQGRVELWYP